ncbi:FecR domain-containing protein [Porifericola rhodea]|uniref:FecR family protein n=1 Tax=Porifericola rhodea TaxID=930972 RepID=UPI002666598B|nr:FecR domain-containing protein [Porifericola rhodea]WKN33865.1 FecR domain-containing protein [Porifericola rhodea]
MADKKYSAKDFLLNEYFLQWVKTSTPAHEVYWQKFLLQHPDAEKAMKEAIGIAESLNFQVQARSATTKHTIKKQIDAALASSTSESLHSLEEEPSTYTVPTREVRPKLWRAVAATLAGFILLAGVYLFKYQSSELTEYTTAYGETQTIILPDESIVTLNANSSLSFSEAEWSKYAERVVNLNGEAYFEVEKVNTKEGSPLKFIVHTDDLDVEVLGTSFNVHTRRQETKVVLSSGSVKLKLEQEAAHPEKEIMMKPGDLVEVDKEKQKVEKSVVNTSLYTSWKENKLIFEHTPVSDIIQMLEDNYGFKVTIPSAFLLKKEFTGAAPADNIQILLDKMSVVYKLNFIRKGNEIIIVEQ